MGNKERDQWMRALPWVLLGRRVAFQPSLDASAAQMVLGMSPRIPGQLLGHPGPPLNTIQLKGLLDKLYKYHDKPAMPMSGKKETFDITDTEKATHVYVKVDNPQSLCPKFEGPYEIYSRPSRSQIEVKIGMFKDGRPRLLTFHWSACQVANLRQGAVPASRPALGRKPKGVNTPHISVPEYGNVSPDGDRISDTSAPDDARPVTDDINNDLSESAGKPETSTNRTSTNEPAKIQTTRPIRSTRNPNPSYIHAITQKSRPQEVVRW